MSPDQIELVLEVGSEDERREARREQRRRVEELDTWLDRFGDDELDELAGDPGPVGAEPYIERAVMSGMFWIQKNDLVDAARRKRRERDQPDESDQERSVFRVVEL